MRQLGRENDGRTKVLLCSAHCRDNPFAVIAMVARVNEAAEGTTFFRKEATHIICSPSATSGNAVDLKQTITFNEANPAVRIGERHGNPIRQSAPPDRPYVHVHKFKCICIELCISHP
jgi:hypothetical protein